MTRQYYADTRQPYRSPSFSSLRQTTMGLPSFQRHNTRWDGRSCVDAATLRRANCVVLALMAWKLEHGQLPDKLDELVGPYLKKLPLDPHSTGLPFKYFPKGISDSDSDNAQR